MAPRIDRRGRRLPCVVVDGLAEAGAGATSAHLTIFLELPLSMYVVHYHQQQPYPEAPVTERPVALPLCMTSRSAAMPPSKTEQLAMAERHVRDGRAIVARQRGLIERYRSRGHSTFASEELLSCFERTQAIFEDDLARLRRQGVLRA